MGHECNASPLVYKVMIASPGDVATERTIIRDVVYEWNFIHSEIRAGSESAQRIMFQSKSIRGRKWHWRFVRTGASPEAGAVQLQAVGGVIEGAGV